MIYHTWLRKCQESFDVTSWRRQLCYFLMSCRDWCSSPTRRTQTCNHRWVVCLLQAWGMASSRFCICSFSAMGLFNLTQNRTLTKKNGIVTTFHLLSVKLLTFVMKINLLLPFTKEPSFIKLNLQSWVVFSLWSDMTSYPVPLDLCLTLHSLRQKAS